MDDKRRHTRFTVMCNAGCMNTEVTVIDISKEGMKIKSSYHIQNREDLTFSVVLPNLDIIKIVGDILWDKNRDDAEYFYGVKIKKLSEEHESTFLSFLHELEESQ